MMRPFLAVLAVLSFFVLHAQAQSNTNPSKNPASAGVIQGTVLDPGGKAIPRASVSLLTPTEALQQGRSDDRGQYAFTGLPSGTYRVTASAPGLAASTGDLQLRSGETQHADVTLALSAVDQRIVVAASLGDVPTTQTASSVSIITADEIASHDAQGISDVLREVPGVAVSDIGRRGGATSAFIRGGNSNYDLVLMDGIPLNQFGGGFSFDFSPLPTDGVAQVEVIRGAQSALYGSDAVSGVVNLITNRSDGPPEFTAALEGGSYGTYRLATGGGGEIHGLSWSYDLSRLGSAGVVPNDNYRNQSAFFSLGFSRSPRRQLEFHFFGGASDAGSPGAYGSDPDHLFFGIDTVSRVKQNLYGYQLSETEQFSPRVRQVSTVSVATYQLHFISSSFSELTQNLRVTANTRSEITLAPTDMLVAGFEYNHEHFEDTFVDGPDGNPFELPRTTLAFFAENRWRPTDRLSVTLGVRVDDIMTGMFPPLIPASTITQVNPRGTGAYLLRRASSQSNWGTTRLHASAGTGIRAPNGFELGATNNPHLKPERSITTDAGIEQRFLHDRAIFDATYFYNSFRDQIVTLGGSLQNLSTFTSDNLNNTRAQGVELSLHLQPLRSLAVSAQYTWMDSAILSLDGSTMAKFPFQVGQPLTDRPRNSAGYDVTWQHGRLRLNTNGYIRGSVLDVEPNFGAFACELDLPCLFTNKGYVLANAGFAVRTLPGVEIYGQLNNFLNQKYEEVLGYPAYHINFMAGVRFHFPGDRNGAGTSTIR